MPESAISLARQPRVGECARPTTRASRGLILGTVLLPFVVLWVLYAEHIGGHGPVFSTISLFPNLVFILFVLAAANGVLRRLRPRVALSQGELIIVYTMLAIGTAVAGLDNMQLLFVAMTHGFWFANPENQYDQLLANGPRWLVVADKQVLYGYYNGSSSLYQRAVLEAWLTPVLWWTGFIVVLVSVMICVSVLVRAQWADRERLTFPIAQLPMAISEPGSSLWQSRPLWVGFGVASAVDIVNGLAFVCPALPHVPVGPTWGGWGSIDLMRYIPDMPWAGIGWLPVTFYPFVIGVCFLMPLDVLFSSVVFFFWWKAMFVIAAALGVSQGWSNGMSKGIFPWDMEQVFGGYIAMAVGPLLIARRYLREVWVRAFRGASPNDRYEGLSYRAALIGVVAGMALLVVFAVHGGQALGLAVLFFVLYGLLSLAVARIRADLGYPVQDFHLAGPGQTISYVAGSASLRQQDLVMFSMLWWFNSCYRAHPIGVTVDGVEMAHRSRSRARGIVIAMGLATVIAVVSVFWGWLHYAYRLGLASGFGGGDWRHEEMMETLREWIQNPSHPNPGALVGIGIGFALTLLLALARSAFPGWPLHPAAYVLAAGWSIHMLWLPMLIAWVTKALVLRYGGLHVYRRDFLPFFYGLILGEAVIGCLWSLLGLILGVQTYSIWGL